MFKLVKKISLLLFVLTTISAHAAGISSYQVEIIVFSQLSQQTVDSEHWPQRALQQPNPAYLNLDQDSDGYNVSAPDQLFLTNQYNKISNKQQYTVLMHKGWVIPRATLNNGILLHLFGGKRYDNSVDTQSSIDGSASYSTTALSELDGTVRIKLNRYFNLSFNLMLNEPNSLIKSLSDNDYFASNTAPYISFKLMQTRRMRSNELNYIDHPLLGVLVKILPHKDTPATAAPIPSVNLAPSQPATVINQPDASPKNASALPNAQ